MREGARIVLHLARCARRWHSPDLWFAADAASALTFGRSLRMHGIGRIHADHDCREHLPAVKDSVPSSTVSKLDKLIAELGVKTLDRTELLQERRRLEQRFLEEHGIQADEIEDAIRQFRLSENDLVRDWIEVAELLE